MKSIPFKRCASSSESFSKALSSFLKSNYESSLAPGEMLELDATLAEIRLAREAVLNLCNNRDMREMITETNIEEFQKYYSMLRDLDRRFPFQQSKLSLFATKASSISFAFQWTDAFSSYKTSTSFSPQIELSSILFNIGAAYSAMAAAIDRSDSESCKKSANLFLKSAGVFQYLYDNANNFAVPDSIDLSPVTLQWLKEFMFAQAASVTFESAIAKNMSPKSISKLAMGASERFEQAKSVLSSSKGLVAHVSTSISVIDHLSYQSLCFKAAALFWYSKVDLEEKEYGVEISRLMYALDIIGQAQKIEPKTMTSKGSRVKLASVISTRLKEAKKDNDSIYYYSVPKFTSLSSIEGRTLGEPIKFEPMSQIALKVFDKFVSSEVKKQCDVLKSDLEKLFRDLSEKVQSASKTVSTNLSRMNLPAALEAVSCENSQNLPAKLWSDIQDFQDKGGVDGLKTLRNEVLEASEGCVDLINRIQSNLEKEAVYDDEMRKRYGKEWRRTTSATVGAEYQNDLKEAQKYMRDAELSDLKVDKIMESEQSQFVDLGKSREQIDRMIPQLSSNSESAETNALRMELNQMNKCLSEMDMKLSQFEDLKSNLDLVSKVRSSSSGISIASILADEKAPFKNLGDDVNELLSSQEAILSRILSAHEAFVRYRTSNDNSKRREEVIQSLNHRVELYKKLWKDMNQGKRFYYDLMTNCLHPLLLNVSGFVAAREAEASMLVEDIEKSQNSSSGTPNPEVNQNWESDSPSAPYMDIEYPTFHRK